MPTYEVTDNKTGRVYEIDGPRPPTPDEVKALIAKNGEQLGRQAAVQKSDWSDEATRMAGQIGGGIVGKVAGSALGPAGAIGGSAVGSGIGSGAAEGLVQLRRKIKGEPTPDMLGAMGKQAVTGAAGDLAFGVGGKALGGIVRGIGAGAKGAWLRVGNRMSKGAVKYGDEGGWKLIKSLKEVPDEAADAAIKAADKVDASIVNIKKAAQDRFGDVLRQESGTQLANSTQPLKDTYQHLMNNRMFYKNSDGQFVISGMKGLNDTLIPFMKRYAALWKANKGRLNVSEARDVLDQIDAIVTDDTLRPQVKYAAGVFKDSLRKSMSESSPEMAAVIRDYDNTMKTIAKSSKILMKEGEQRVVNPEKVSKFNRLHKEQQDALRAVADLESTANVAPGTKSLTTPGGHLTSGAPSNFMKDVNKAAFLEETSPLTSPNRGLSMIGAGWGLVQMLKGNPGLAAAIGAGEAMMSPRLAAYTLGLRQRGLETLSNSTLARLAKKPAAQAVTDITQRFGLANRLGGLMTSQGMRQSQDEQEY